MTRRQPRDTTPTCPTCGWVGKTTTAGFARHSLSIHRCSREQQRREVAARVAARLADNGPRRDCHHKIARHEHGTRTAYVLDRCRCRACRDANSAAERQMTRAQAYGRWQPYIDADPTRAHIARLRADGIGLKRIAALSGVAHGTLWKLVYGKPRVDGTCVPSRRCRPETAARILAVTASLEHLGSVVLVDATGTRRRMQALVAIGWSISCLGRRLGITNIHNTIASDQVYARTALAVSQLYAELWDVRPPETTHRERYSASRARNYAAAHGWLPPIWWDDDMIEDPQHEPTIDLDEPRGVDEVAIRRRIGGDRTVHLTRAERWHLIRLMHADGHNDQQIARRTGINDRQVLRDRKTLGLPAVSEGVSA